MGALSSPLHVAKRFAQAFRASKRGLRPAQYTTPLVPKVAQEAAVRLHDLALAHGSLTAARRAGQDYVGGSQALRTALYMQPGHSEIRQALAVARQKTIPLTKAERYGGILGKGYRREPVQLHLFTGRVHGASGRTWRGRQWWSPEGSTVQQVRSRSRKDAFQRMTDAMKADFHSIPAVDAFRAGRYGRWGATRDEIQQLRRHPAYNAGRLFRKGMPVSRRLEPFAPTNIARNIGKSIGKSNTVFHFRRGLKYGAVDNPHWSLHLRLAAAAGNAINKSTGVPRQFIRGITQGSSISPPRLGLEQHAYHAGSKVRDLGLKAKQAARQTANVYDRALVRMNRATAQRFGGKTKIKIQEMGAPVRTTRTADWGTADYSPRILGEHPDIANIREFAVKGNRIPMGVAAVTAREYGRKALIDAVPLVEGRRAPGYPRFAIHPGAPMSERVRNLRQTFHLLRQQHPGVHEWAINKAVPKSRSVRELERMVGAEGSEMKLRRLRYTRENRPHL